MHPALSKAWSAAKYGLRLYEFNRRRGTIIAVWAAVETSMDLANSYAWELSERKISKVVPISLRWKLQMFEQIHRDTMPLDNLRRQAAALLERISSLQDDRHWLVHGIIAPHYSMSDGWILKKGDFQRDGSVKFVDKHFTAKHLERIEVESMKLSLQMARYAASVLLTMAKRDRDNERS
jgi:hypothetical protein